MAKQKKNPYLSRFITGLCSSGTPYSTRIYLKGKEVTNPIHLEAAKLLNDETINFWDDNWTESFCYFSGGLLGLTLIPIDALITGVLSVREKLKVKN